MMPRRTPEQCALSFAAERLKYNYPRTHPFLGDACYFMFGEISLKKLPRAAYFFHHGASVMGEPRHVDAMLTMLLSERL